MGIPLTSLAPLEDALRLRPFGLLSDVDGTLSPLVPTPAEARVTPRNLALLQALSRRIVVAAVSGRDLTDLRRMVDIPTLVHVGLHGLAWWRDGREEIEPEGDEYRVLTQQAAAELSPLQQIDGLAIEVKTVGIALHYRGAPDQAAAREMILKALAASPAAALFRIHEGICLVELRPPIGISKGVALRRMAERFGLRSLLFLGDDVTDIDGFVEARRLREEGELRAYGIAVAHAEAPAAAAETADFTVPDVGGVEWLLGEIAAAVGANEPGRADAPEL